MLKGRVHSDLRPSRIGSARLAHPFASDHALLGTAPRLTARWRWSPTPSVDHSAGGETVLHRDTVLPNLLGKDPNPWSRPDERRPETHKIAIARLLPTSSGHRPRSNSMENRSTRLTRRATTIQRRVRDMIVGGHQHPSRSRRMSADRDPNRLEGAGARSNTSKKGLSTYTGACV
jgi:hypothetical protein